jgi:hypothetical protein
MFCGHKICAARKILKLCYRPDCAGKRVHVGERRGKPNYLARRKAQGMNHARHPANADLKDFSCGRNDIFQTWRLCAWGHIESKSLTGNLRRLDIMTNMLVLVFG